MKVRNNFIIRHTGCNRPGPTSAADSHWGPSSITRRCFFLENKGAAVRLPTRFREYAIGRKQQNSKELLGLLSKCDLLRHLPPEGIEAILPYIRPRRLDAGEILFRAGDQGDALYIVAHGSVKVLADLPYETTTSRPIATLRGRSGLWRNGSAHGRPANSDSLRSGAHRIIGDWKGRF